jgi:hypothetical protein
MVGTILGLLGLAFTLGSFWWLWLRHGNLTATTPPTYGMVASHRVQIRLPMVFYNTGATPIVVENLLLLIGDDAQLEWLSIRRTVRPMANDVVDNAAPFAVQGRSTERLVVEFEQITPTFSPEPSTKYRLRMQARERGRHDWTDIHVFDWWSPIRGDLMTAYVAHRNAPIGGPVE